jgi:ribonuclease HII
VSFVDNDEIDKINIRNARFQSMHDAINKLCIKPELLLIDGDVFPKGDKLGISYKCIVGGDNIYQSIAAASILAKCERDDYMIKLDESYPNYNWKNNKGYGTKDHYVAIQKHGPTQYHRKTFNLSIKNTNHVVQRGVKIMRNLDKCVISDDE